MAAGTVPHSPLPYHTFTDAVIPLQVLLEYACLSDARTERPPPPCC